MDFEGDAFMAIYLYMSIYMINSLEITYIERSYYEVMPLRIYLHTMPSGVDG